MAKQRKVDINGTTYTLQHPGARASVQMRDKAKDRNGNLLEEKFYSAIIDNVVVEPKVSWDYFEDQKPEDFEPLMIAAAEFLTGVSANTQ